MAEQAVTVQVSSVPPPKAWHHHYSPEVLFLLSISLVIVFQVALVQWKQRYYASFRNITLFGIWAFPPLVAVHQGFFLFLFVWVIFTVASAFLIKKALEKPIVPTTPRLVYQWFYRIYQICYALAAGGYIFIMLDYLLFALQFTPSSLGLTLAFYGFYFGVMGRDLSELCSDHMAATIGFKGKRDELPEKDINPSICGICNGALQSDSEEKVSKLDGCGHSFHGWCIRGWTIVGKKDTCPYCAEKVNIKITLTNPWEAQDIMWGNLLDTVRYLIVWNPIIIFLINAVISFIDPETP